MKKDALIIVRGGGDLVILSLYSGFSGFSF